MAVTNLNNMVEESISDAVVNQYGSKTDIYREQGDGYKCNVAHFKCFLEVQQTNTEHFYYFFMKNSNRSNRHTHKNTF